MRFSCFTFSVYHLSFIKKKYLTNRTRILRIKRIFADFIGEFFKNIRVNPPNLRNPRSISLTYL